MICPARAPCMHFLGAANKAPALFSGNSREALATLQVTHNLHFLPKIGEAQVRPQSACQRVLISLQDENQGVFKSKSSLRAGPNHWTPPN